MNAFLLFPGDVAAEATVANSKQLFSGVIHLLLLPGLLFYIRGGVSLLPLPILTTKITSGLSHEIPHPIFISALNNVGGWVHYYQLLIMTT